MDETARVELDALLDRQRRLEAAVAEVSAQERSALAEAQAASDALVALERAAALGEKATAAHRREAEDAVLRTKTAVAAPWGERRRAAELAAGDARQRVALFVGANLDELLGGLEAEGQAAATAIDEAARVLLDAISARAEIEQRTFALVSLVRRAQPGDVARARSDTLAAEAAKLLEGGGERPPTVLVRPDQGRHAAALVQEAVA